MWGEEPGVQPAGLEHLLAYGAQHYQEGQISVVALGSAWEKLVTAAVPSPTDESSSVWMEMDQPIPPFTTRTFSLGRFIPYLGPRADRAALTVEEHGRGLGLMDIREWEMEWDEYSKLVVLEEHDATPLPEKP
jgi:hypothetical protein